jgi:bile acid-coenzyme A ligase
MTQQANMIAAAGEPVCFGVRLRQHAAERPDRTAVTVLKANGTVEDTTWAELDAMVDRVAHVLRHRLVGEGAVVGIGLANGLLHIATVLACWRLGSTILGFDPALPLSQIEALLEKAAVTCAVVEDGIGGTDGLFLSRTALASLEHLSPEEKIADRIPRPGRIVLSGGSTGLPKLMADNEPWTSIPGRPWGNVARALGFRPDQRQLVCGVMSHNAPLTWAHLGLFEGHHLVVMERFDASRALKALDDYHIQFVMVVPTMMVRMLDALDQAAPPFPSLEAFYHTAAFCPVWLKKAWIGLLGAERVFEMYGSGENVGQTVITGPEWLAHPGSVGRPFETEARVRGPDGAALPPGEIGELFLRRSDGADRVRYLDAAVTFRVDVESFASIGDMAFLDAEGYVYLTGRRDDVINTGGVKVHPERVEAALLSHPHVRDAVVVGIADREWGERVHAVIELHQDGSEVDIAALKAHCSTRLASAEVPKSIAFVEKLPRDGFGKIKRRLAREMGT